MLFRSLLGYSVILSDFDLRNYIRSGRLFIDPLSEDVIRENGVDLRLGEEYCELIETNEVLDPYSEDVDIEKFYRCSRAEEYVIKPNKRYLLHTLEPVSYTHLTLPTN